MPGSFVIFMAARMEALLHEILYKDIVFVYLGWIETLNGRKKYI